MYALTTDSQTVTTTATLPPTGARRLDTGAWVTPPADSWTAELLAACGWLPVTRTSRPTDDASAYDWSVELVDGQPVETWTPRAWTPQEEADRAEQAARFDGIEARLARIEAHLWPADTDPTPDTPIPTMDDYAGVWPVDKLLSDGGKIWRNITTVPLTTAPSGFPGGGTAWIGQLFVEVTAAEPEPDYPNYRGEWSPDVTYAKGDHVSKDGTVYRCEIAHGPEQQGQWAPGVAHTVWTVA